MQHTGKRYKFGMNAMAEGHQAFLNQYVIGPGTKIRRSPYNHTSVSTSQDRGGRDRKVQYRSCGETGTGKTPLARPLPAV